MNTEVIAMRQFVTVGTGITDPIQYVLPLVLECYTIHSQVFSP
jgi:hypothetical protein